MSGVTYDTGALIAAERNSRVMWALHVGFLADVTPVVPVAVIAEAWRGGSRQARLAQLLASCSVEEMSLAQAKSVGVLAGKAGHEDVVDATVVEGAIRRSDAVVTSNAAHIKKIASGVRTRLELFEV